MVEVKNGAISSLPIPSCRAQDTFTFLVQARMSRLPGILRACPGIALNASDDDEGRGVVAPHTLNSHTLHCVTCFTPITLLRRQEPGALYGQEAGRCPGPLWPLAAKINTATPFGNQIPLLCCRGPNPNQYKHLTDYRLMLKVVKESLKFDTTIWTTDGATSRINMNYEEIRVNKLPSTALPITSTSLQFTFRRLTR
jgi:hypothetical protein